MIAQSNTLFPSSVFSLLVSSKSLRLLLYFMPGPSFWCSVADNSFEIRECRPEDFDDFCTEPSGHKTSRKRRLKNLQTRNDEGF
jgi:hypothetical protein